MTSPTDPAPSDPAPSDPDCLFCKIAAGDIPATIVHESETTVAFRDLNPQAPTHVLVIPRSHYPNAAALAEAEPATAVHLFDAAREIAAQEGIDGDDGGYRMVLNTGAAAHQTVFHAHLHVLGGRPMTWPPG
ncbi:histidine triad nucleotide-binding protein [Nocardioides immobilis]|uniref:Histidine triad nucleotide-binding protein n=1 Tax=Nocardioides immobilis TaxID=2049295 RepID=A0A417XW61_9ACTN|nr:histidine triad nucleotide-binding protein [Nocardioides immobilis]RHW24545.1 histidine triad nucleotide-binding protein [Nocardioides immobilis]